MIIEWSPLAIAKVKEIASYIRQDSPASARKWASGITASVKRLKDHPLSGRKVPELNFNKVREVIFGAYRVIYRVDTLNNKIYILTVRRGSQRLNLAEIIL